MINCFRFDIDAELAKVDTENNKQVSPPSDRKQKHVDIDGTLHEENLTDEEKTQKAVREKDKGNEVR